MAKQLDLDKSYMKCAFAMSELSHAQRRKVGAILVAQGINQQTGGIIAEGVNGTPAGFSNACEDDHHKWTEVPIELGIDATVLVCAKCGEESDSTNGGSICGVLHTVPECLHAESNAIAKVARSTNSSNGATIYTTLSPCFQCAKLIIQAGIVRVVYAEQYEVNEASSSTCGLELLRKAGVQLDHLDMYDNKHERELEPYSNAEGVSDATEDMYRQK